jgi:hypothetical protein
LIAARNGQVGYELKTPWRNGTTPVIFEPLDFIARLVALVPKPRVNLTRFHAVFAPNSKYRSKVTPATSGSSPVRIGEKLNVQTNERNLLTSLVAVRKNKICKTVAN